MNTLSCLIEYKGPVQSTTPANDRWIVNERTPDWYLRYDLVIDNENLTLQVMISMFSLGNFHVCVARFEQRQFVFDLSNFWDLLSLSILTYSFKDSFELNHRK